MDIGKGDWVECVDASPTKTIQTGLRLGAIHQVEDIVWVGAYRKYGVLLIGLRHPATLQGAFNSQRFRPIYRPKADLIEHLKAPPQHVTEDA